MAEFSIIQILGSSLIAAMIGFMTGIFGVGGGFLMTPMLIILLNIKGNVAVGTDLVIIFFNSSVAMLKRRGTDTIDFKLAVWLAIGGIAGSQLGVSLMHSLKNISNVQLFGKSHDPVELTLLSLFLILLSWIALFMLHDIKSSQGKSPQVRIGLFDKIKLRPYRNFWSLEKPRISIVPIVLLGLSTGILTSLMGVGGGVIMLPSLIYLVGQRAVKAAGTSLFFVWLISIVSGTSHFFNGNIKFLLLPGMLIGGFVGTWFGSNVGLKLKGPKIRKYFIVLVAAAVAMVAFKLALMLFGNASDDFSF